MVIRVMFCHLCYSNKTITYTYYTSPIFPAPHPTSAMYHTAHSCKDSKRGTTDAWFVYPEQCESKDLTGDTTGVDAAEIVFSVLIPHKGLDMSRWHQFMVGVISIQVDAKDKPRK